MLFWFYNVFVKLANDNEDTWEPFVIYWLEKVGPGIPLGKNESLEKFDLGLFFFFFHFLHSPWFFIALV